MSDYLFPPIVPFLKNAMLMAMGALSPRVLIKLGTLAILLFVAIAPSLIEHSPFHSSPRSTLRISFLDVGQGDAIFIQAPGGKQVLIDGGPDSSVLSRLTSEMGYFDRTIDMVVATHEDRDHVGGLPSVFDHYEVGTFLRTENQGESTEAHIIDDLSKREGSDIVYARRGMVFDLGSSTTLTVLFPERDPSMLESNTSSIIAKLTYGSQSFLLTGDSPAAIESYLLSIDSEALRSSVLKLGHHGSRTSSSEAFLKAVAPAYAIVSSGKNNRYGHPHTEVVDLLEKLNIPMLNTAEEGTLSFESDGVTLERK